MAQEPTETTASEATSGDVAEATAETTEATATGDVQQLTVEELLAERESLRRERDLAVSIAQRRGDGPDAGERPTDTRDPQSEAVRTQMSDNLKRRQKLEGRIRALADSDDPLSQFQLEMLEDQKAGLEAVAQSLRFLHDKIELLDVDKPERDAFKSFYEKNRHRVADMDAARLMFDGLRAREAAKNPAPAAGARPARPRGPNVDVSAHTRSVPAREHSDRARMTEEQFDNQVESLRAEGRFAEARALQSRYREGEIELTTKG